MSRRFHASRRQVYGLINWKREPPLMPQSFYPSGYLVDPHHPIERFFH
jgi:hypothetical protein